MNSAYKLKDGLNNAIFTEYDNNDDDSWIYIQPRSYSCCSNEKTAVVAITTIAPAVSLQTLYYDDEGRMEEQIRKHFPLVLQKDDDVYIGKVYKRGED